MGAARQRILNARVNRQASRTARYGTASFPQPTNFEGKNGTVSVEKRGPGRPPISISRPNQQEGESPTVAEGRKK